MTAQHDRLQPQDLEAEAWILSSILLDREAVPRVAGILGGPEDFYRENNGDIYRAMVALYDAGEPIDNITLAAELEKAQKLTRVGGRPHLAALLQIAVTASSAEYYALIVKEKAMKRSAIGVGLEIVSGGFDDSKDASDVIAGGQEKLLQLAITGSATHFRRVGHDVEELAARAQARQGGGLTGLSTGFSTLDDITGGHQKSELTIIAGRPSMGKTSLALNIALYQARKLRQPVGIFSLEMSWENLQERLACQLGRLDHGKLRRGVFNDEEWGQFYEALGPLSDLPIFIDDTDNLTTTEMLGKIRALHNREKLALVVVDYLQLVHGPNSNRVRNDENRAQEVGSIARALRGMARELQVPVLAVSQLSRAPEGRPDKRPIMSDLAESGGIEAAADVVMLIYRDDYYYANSDEPGIAEINVAKNRNGATGRVKLHFERQLTEFRPLTWRESA